MAKISVIVPVYKVEPYLHRCVDSILNQTFTDFELVLVDDGSPDNCGAICDEYAEKDDRIIVIHQENKGVSSARNSGIKIASGKYIVFVDSDDYIDTGYLQNLYIHKSDLTISGFVTHNENDDILWILKFDSLTFNSRDSIDFSFLYKEKMVYSPYGKLFCADIINSNDIMFNEKVHWGEDGIFVADYLAKIDSLSIIPYTEYHYIKYGDNSSLSTTFKETIFDTITFAREYCIEKAKCNSPKYYEKIKIICEEDIKYNCSYFIVQLFKTSNISNKRKAQLLDVSRQNEYVENIMARTEIYFKSNIEIQKSLSETNSYKIVKKYKYLLIKYKIKEFIYSSIYLKLTTSVKQIYQTIRKNKR